MAFTRAPISAVITDATGNTINLGNASGAFTAAPLSIVLTDAAGKTLNVGQGIVAKADLAAQQANVGSTLLYAVPAGQGGTYRMSVVVTLTQAATTSSTLPRFLFSYTDGDVSLVIIQALTPTSTSNSLGTTSGGSDIIGSPIFQAKAGTNINISTDSYASSGATPMQFAVHAKLEYLGA